MKQLILEKMKQPYKMNDGGTYVGSLDPEGYPHGHGTRTYADGFKYIGNWENGTQMDSYAQLFYPDGHKYYGGFKDGKRHGSGTMIFPDGKQKVESGKTMSWLSGIASKRLH